MYCTKCGKEIPEGESKVCEECQKKLLEEITAEEVAEKTEESKKETKKKEKAEKKKQENDKKTEKFEPKEEVKKSNKIAFIIIAIILLIILGIVGIWAQNKRNTEGLGNSIGNIRNYGYASDSNGWIYYLAPNEDSSQVGIFKVKKDGTKNQQLFMNEGDGEKEIVSINVVGNYIYFIMISSNENNSVDRVDNKIYRMKTNGSGLEIINDNELNNDCYEIYVVNGYVYYIDVDANVAKMKIDGSDKQVVSENGTGYLGITEDYIIFNKLKDDTTTDFVTYIMNIDGTNPRPIIQDKRVFSVNVEGDYIYYTNQNKTICRTKIDSNTEEVISETEAYNLNVENGYAYYLNYVDAEAENFTVCIYKINLNAEDKNAEVIMQLDTYSSFLNVVGDWALYMDSNDLEGFINLVKTDGSKETVQLYNLNYEEYYNKRQQETEAQGTTEVPEEMPEDATTNEGEEPGKENEDTNVNELVSTGENVNETSESETNQIN